MTTWLVMIIVAVGTYGLRVSMLVAHDRLGGSAWLAQRLSIVGPAVLAAVVASALFVSGTERVSPSPAQLAAVATALVVVRWRGNVGWALLAGFPVYWVGTAL